MEEDFIELQNKLERGYNLCIYGFDGRIPRAEHLTVLIPSNDQELIDLMYKDYLDVSSPFGHEFVLYSMLVIEDSYNYPWNIYYREHSKIYKDVI